MRLLISFCLISAAAAQPGGLAFLNQIKQGGLLGGGGAGNDGGGDPCGGRGPFGGLSGGGGMGGMSGDGPPVEFIKRIMGPCSCAAEPRPRGEDCLSQMKAVKDCAKNRIKVDLDFPSREERMEMKGKVKALKKDILDNCFDRPCKNPRKAMRQFAECMEPKVTKRGGVLPKFKKCMEGQGIQIPQELQDKFMNKAQELFAKVLRGGANDDDDDDGEEEEDFKGFGMMMMRGAGEGNEEKKLEMLENLAGAVCPNKRSANRAAKCVRRKIQRAKLDQPTQTRPCPDPRQMLSQAKAFRTCTCRASDACKGKMEQFMDAVCSCKASINKRQIKRQVGRCAKQVGINTDGLGDIMKKVKSKMSEMCSEEMKEKKEKMKAIMQCDRN